MAREYSREMLYRKIGTRYYAVKEFTGFPADGLWFVQGSSKIGTTSKHVFGVDQIHLFSDKDSQNLIHQLETYRKALMAGLVEELEKWEKGSLLSPNEIVTAMIRRVVEYEFKKSLAE